MGHKNPIFWHILCPVLLLDLIITYLQYSTGGIIGNISQNLKEPYSILLRNWDIENQNRFYPHSCWNSHKILPKSWHDLFKKCRNYVLLLQNLTQSLETFCNINCLSVFDHFVRLALKRLITIIISILASFNPIHTTDLFLSPWKQHKTSGFSED